MLVDVRMADHPALRTLPNIGRTVGRSLCRQLPASQ